jgi:excisionase family DNA binding protein
MQVMVVNSDTRRIFVDRAVAAVAIGVSLPTLDKLIRSGRLEAARVGRRVLVKKDSLERLGDTK